MKTSTNVKAVNYTAFFLCNLLKKSIRGELLSGDNCGSKVTLSTLSMNTCLLLTSVFSTILEAIFKSDSSDSC